MMTDSTTRTFRPFPPAQLPLIAASIGAIFFAPLLPIVVALGALLVVDVLAAGVRHLAARLDRIEQAVSGSTGDLSASDPD